MASDSKPIRRLANRAHPSTMRSFLLAALFVAAAAANVQNYQGYTVLRVQVENLDQADALVTLEKTGLYDFWTEVKKQGPVDIMAKNGELADLAEYLTASDVSFTTMVEDVQSLIDEAKMNYGAKDAKQGHNMDWTSYHPLEDMYSYWDYIEGREWNDKSVNAYSL